MRRWKKQKVWNLSKFLQFLETSRVATICIASRTVYMWEQIDFDLYGIWAKLNIVRDSLIWKCDQIEKLTLKTRKISRTERSIWFSRWKISYRHPQSKFWIFENFIFFSKRNALSKTESFLPICQPYNDVWWWKINYFLMSTRGGSPCRNNTCQCARRYIM